MADDPRHSFCFVHAADLHLDTPFKGVHEAAPHVAEALREASLAAFDAIVELCLDRHAAFLVVAGDVYDGAERGLRAQLRFRDGLARLAGAGIASFVVHGNHDPVGAGWSAIRSWPDGVTIFGSDSVEAVPVVHGGEVIATVQGISYAKRETTENLALRFTRPDSGGLQVGLLHCNVQGAAQGYADYSPCTLEDLRSAHLDYWALGHIHQQRVLATGSAPGDPYVVYSGNSQARSPRVSERGPKGAVVVHVENGRVDRIEPVACDSVRFDELDLSIENIGGLEELEERLLGGSEDLLAAADGRSLVVRVRLGGRGQLHSELARPGTLDGLLVHLRDAAGAPERFCWWDAIEDATAAELDLERVRGRVDFSSDLLALAEGTLEDHDASTALGDELASGVPRALSRDLADVLASPARLRDLLGAATTMALDELAGGEP